jgi:small subunit ribosomal protein S8
MAQQDLTADMLTRIRNAVRNHDKRVKVLNNKLNQGVASVLQSEGYIEGFDVIDDGRQGVIDIKLRYGPRGEDIIRQIEKYSKPGRRVYSKVNDLPRPLQGMGIAIVSTSQGVLSDRQCRDKRVSGEVVAIVS